jgi:hypothetical protein
MRINFAHNYAPAAAGGRIDYAVFGARSMLGTDEANSAYLARLTIKARLLGLKVDQSALAYEENGGVKFWGNSTLVDHLAGVGLPRWTHWIED